MPLFVDEIEIEQPQFHNLHASSLLSIRGLGQTSKNFSTMPCRKLLQSDKTLYINQREFGVVSRDDNVVKFIGSEDATTCHIVVMKTSTAIGLGHFDGAGTREGLVDMVDEVIKKPRTDNPTPHSNSHQTENFIEVHIFGGFLDDRGISDKLLTEILVILCQISANFNIMTACVGDVNSKIVNGNNEPVICGVGVDIASGNIFPSTFDYKGPNEWLRHARIFGGSENMSSIYNSVNNSLKLCPFLYETPPNARLILSLVDYQILQYLSTSPHCEPDYFVSSTRKTLQYLIENPDPRLVFRDWQPLIFKMDPNGLWKEQ